MGGAQWAIFCMNKDEADRCIKLSKEHLQTGNRDKALKFAKKAISLHDSPEAHHWLQTLLKASQDAPKQQAKQENKENKPKVEEVKEEQRPYTKVLPG